MSQPAPHPPGRRLLLIDPEASFRRVLREQLEQDGAWRVEEAADIGAIGTAAAPDLVVATVSGRPARAALVQWRQTTGTPLVALVRPGAREVVGASLTIAKPVRLSELLGVIATLGRQGGEPASAQPDYGTAHRRIGPYRFDPAAKQLIEGAGARTIRLTEKEVAMLDLLWHAAGKVVPRAALLAQVWGYQAGLSTHTLETHVYRLRRKIEGNPGHAELLITEPGGYRLVR